MLGGKHHDRLERKKRERHQTGNGELRADQTALLECGSDKKWEWESHLTLGTKKRLFAKGTSQTEAAALRHERGKKESKVRTSKDRIVRDKGVTRKGGGRACKR